MVERILVDSDCLDNLEDEFRKEHSSHGYQTGFDLGKKAGEDEGYSQGLVEGEKRGSEVGFYKGYTMTMIQLLQSSEPSQSAKSTKLLNKLNEVIELADTFPKTNEQLCEERLSDIRVKYKQSTSLLNFKL